MKTAQDYPMSIGYGYTGSPYSKAKPHRGKDLLTPNRTPLMIQGLTIALTGNSGSYNGMTYGYHLHIQAGTDSAVQNTVNPEAYAFQGGVVTSTGTGKEWGKFVILKTISGIYVAYCHLSEIQCKVGDIIGANNMAIITNSDSWYSRCNDTHTRIRGRTLDRNTFKSYVGKDFLKFVEDCSDNPEADAQYKYSVIGRQASTQFEEVTEKLYRKKSV